MSTGKTIRTLLLCKLNLKSQEKSIDLFDQLREVYSGPGKKNKAVFATFGKIDAVSLYDTLQTHNSNWMKDIYNDRKRIIHQSNSKFSYHPIHLVANENYTNIPQYNFAVITLIYGVIKRHPAQNNEFQCYEDYIKKQFLQKYAQGAEGDFQVYNATNICDVVLIHFTNNLQQSLEISNSLNEQGNARKTLSLICFLLTDKPSLPQLANGTYSIRVEGSVKDQTKYLTYKNRLIGSVYGSDERDGLSDKIVFGQSDFCIQFTDLNSSQVNNLFNAMFQNFNLMIDSCWDCHTDFLRNTINDPLQDNSDSITNDSASQSNPKDILSPIYEKFSAMSMSIEEDPNSILNKLPWYDAFYELLSVHANIDKNPVLHGPSYLVYRFVSITFDYLKNYKDEDAANNANKKKKKKNNKNKPMQDAEYYKKIFSDSRDTIENAIRGWSSLTDQILRIDDLVFHGIGNNTALYNTLPECIIDFYHAMFNKVIDFIYKRDIYNKVANREIDENTFSNNANAYCYDFLFLPSVGRNVNVDQMFYVKKENQISNYFNLSMLEKQVYLIEFPLNAVYDPVTFFSRLVHECFHVLGDACRCRAKRNDYLCNFTSELIISEIFDSCSDTIKSAARETILSTLKKEFFDVVEATEDTCKKLLHNGTDAVFSGATLNKLHTITKHSVELYDSKKYTLNFNDEELNYILFYFKECYADLMMVLLLNLTPKQYYSIFIVGEESFRAIDHIQTIQRIAAVSLVLCNSQQLPGWSKRSIKRGAKKYFSITFPEETAYRHHRFYLCDFLFEYYSDLAKEKNDHTYCETILSKLCIIPCMNEVKKYLNDVIKAFLQHYSIVLNQDNLPADKQWLYPFVRSIEDIKVIQSDFNNLFVQDGMFSSDFFKRISEDHNAVNLLVNKNQEATDKK